MAAREYTAAFTHRYGIYVMIFIAFGLVSGFLYAFNFTTLFGVPPQ
jgi:hypothetical protein